MKKGLSHAELEEVLYTMLPYTGFPAAQSAKEALLEHLRRDAAGTKVESESGRET